MSLVARQSESLWRLKVSQNRMIQMLLKKGWGASMVGESVAFYRRNGNIVVMISNCCLWISPCSVEDLQIAGFIPYPCQ